MKNYIVRYGLIGGCAMICLGLINWFTVARYGVVASQTIGYLGIILSLMCVPLGIKYFRDKLNGGTVSFGKGLRIGLGITFVTSVVTYFYGLLFFVFAGDSFEEWNKKGLSQTELAAFEMRMEQTPDFVFTPWFQGLIIFLMVFTIGLIISLISSLILRRSGKVKIG